MNNGTNNHELKLNHQEKKQIEQRLKAMSSQDSGVLDLNWLFSVTVFFIVLSVLFAVTCNP